MSTTETPTKAKKPSNMLVITARVPRETAKKIKAEASAREWSVTKAAGRALEKFYS